MATHPNLRAPKRARGINSPHPSKKRLKLTRVFREVYRRGRWAHGARLSVGVQPNALGEIRVGLRTARGLKGAVVRNRLKRQIRETVFDPQVLLREGLDLVLVIRHRAVGSSATELKHELRTLCARLKVLS